MSEADAWRPTATRETLRARSRMMASIRSFFADRGVMEVETPALTRAGATDPQLEPATARMRSIGPGRVYLATSPELEMKRLLAAGCGDIYQVARVFRDGELGRWHQPEFTLLEWYRVGWDERELMDEVETLIRCVVEPHLNLEPTVRMSYRDAFLECLGVGGLEQAADVSEKLDALGIDVPPGLTRDGLEELAFATAVAPRLNPAAISFVYDFPESQAALARLKPTAPPVAARFEAFLGGLELANGFDELTDAAEQRARFAEERERLERAGRRAPPLDEAFLAALAHGLPRCAGVAVGLDRLLAAAMGLGGVAETMSFAHARTGRDLSP